MITDLAAAVAAVSPSAQVTHNPSPATIATFAWPGVGGIGFRAWNNYVRITWRCPVSQAEFDAVIDAVAPWRDPAHGITIQRGGSGGWPVIGLSSEK